MDLGPRLGQLTYSTLVHPGDTWTEMLASLGTYTCAVKERVSPDRPFGVSLRLSAASAEFLAGDPDERARLRDMLASNGLYVFTVNAFPYGPFKGRQVMADVYEPDWQTEARVRYTQQVADVIADVTPPDVSASIQTAPLAFRPNVASPGDVERLTHNVLRVVAYLVNIERTTGRRLKLALEPEPFCYLTSTQDAVDYFQRSIFSAEATRTLSRLTGLAASEMPSVVRRHLGVVFDIGHQSVEFEDIGASLALLVAAGIPIFKLQAAAALWVPEVNDESVHELASFTNTIYLSQTTQRRDGVLTRYLNLGDAITAWNASPGGDREWRVHFHVPVFLDDLGPFRTTRSGIEKALAMHVATPLSDHLEIETYTWDVLPSHLKTGDITDYVTREIEWTRAELNRHSPFPADPGATEGGS